MDVSEAVDSRKSIRAFLDKAVDDSLIKELLEKTSRSASGGNLQPWQIYVILYYFLISIFKLYLKKIKRRKKII